MRGAAVIVAFALVVVGVQLRIARNEEQSRSAAATRIADGILRITILGDSVGHGAGDESGRGIAGDLDAIFATDNAAAAPVTNMAVNGSRTYNVLARLHERATRAAIRVADVVIVSIGGNDLYGDAIARLRSLAWSSHAMRLALDGVNAVVSSIHRTNPAARVILLGLYDPYRKPFLDRAVAQWDAHLIERFAGDRSVDVIRIADVLAQPERISSIDHFHPGAAGYALVAARIHGAL
jgi:lysophospholipase L1-like esterase